MGIYRFVVSGSGCGSGTSINVILNGQQFGSFQKSCDSRPVERYAYDLYRQSPYNIFSPSDAVSINGQVFQSGLPSEFLPPATLPPVPPPTIPPISYPATPPQPGSPAYTPPVPVSPPAQTNPCPKGESYLATWWEQLIGCPEGYTIQGTPFLTEKRCVCQHGAQAAVPAEDNLKSYLLYGVAAIVIMKLLDRR